MSLLISWLILSLAFWITSAVLPGFQVRRFTDALIAAAIFGLLNALIGWFLFVVLGTLTLGIGFLLAVVTRWIVNAILLKITDAATDRLSINKFSTALIAALIISVVGSAADILIRQL